MKQRLKSKIFRFSKFPMLIGKVSNFWLKITRDSNFFNVHISSGNDLIQ